MNGSIPVLEALLHAVKRFEKLHDHRSSHRLMDNIVCRDHINIHFLLDVCLNKRYRDVELSDLSRFLRCRSEHHGDDLDPINRREYASAVVSAHLPPCLHGHAPLK